MTNKTPTNLINIRSAKLTMEQVRERILADRDLDMTKRIVIAGALASMAKACGMPLDTMPADSKLIGEQLQGFAPAQIGLAESTWTTRLSLVRVAFRRTGVIKEPGRRTERFAPAWTKVMRLPATKSELIGLSRFARFCSNQGVDPDQVSDAVFDSFLDDLQNNQIVKRAKKVHRRAAQIWNQLADTTLNWPSQRVTVPSYSRRYAVDWDTLTPQLRADVEAHLNHVAGGDVLTCLDVKPLKASSIRTRRHQIHILVSGMVYSGVDASTLMSLADVVAVNAVRKGLLFLAARGKDGSKAQVHDVSRTAISIARHWVKVSPPHLAELQKFCKCLDPGDDGMTAENKRRLRQFDDRANQRKLLQLPVSLVKKARKWEVKPTVAHALLMQTALVIEILLLIPIRRHNLVSIDIQKHIIRHADGTVFLMIDGNEVKNGVEIDAQFPPHLIKMLDHYLKIYRPLLLPGRSNWLIPGVEDRHKSRERLGLQISDTIKRETGLSVNTHLFRHIDAKLYLDQNPGAYAVVQRLLGHKSLSTTMKVYSGLERRSLTAHYDQTILKLRRDLGAGSL